MINDPSRSQLKSSELSASMSKLSALLNDWRERVKREQFSHRFAAKGCARLHLALGVLVATGTGIAGSYAYNFPQDILRWPNVLVIVAFVLITIKALHSLARYDQVSRWHHGAEVGFNTLRLKIELKLASVSTDIEVPEAFCREVIHEFESLSRQAPPVSERYWRKARKLIVNKARDRKKKRSETHSLGNITQIGEAKRK